MRRCASPPYASCPTKPNVCVVWPWNPPAALDRQRDLMGRILPKNLALSADRHFTTNVTSGPEGAIAPKRANSPTQRGQQSDAHHAASDFGRHIRPLFSA